MFGLFKKTKPAAQETYNYTLTINDKDRENLIFCSKYMQLSKSEYLRHCLILMQILIDAHKNNTNVKFYIESDEGRQEIIVFK